MHAEYIIIIAGRAIASAFAEYSRLSYERDNRNYNFLLPLMRDFSRNVVKDVPRL